MAGDGIAFRPDRAVYIRSHWTLAAVAMAAGMAILWAMGNPHVWTGAIGGLAAIALRGWYLMDEELDKVWTLRDGVLHGPRDFTLPQTQIAKARTLGHSIQIVTHSGDKHLIKFLPDPAAAAARIDPASGAAR